MKIEWQQIESNNGHYMYRAKVIGGWLVLVCNDVLTSDFRSGYEWRESVTFVPDPNHEWK